MQVYQQRSKDMTTQLEQAARLALEALESYKGFIDDAHNIEGQWHWIDGGDEAITALRAALEQPDRDAEQRCYCGNIFRLGVIHREDSFCDEQPAQDEPVGQLLEEIYGRGQVMWFKKPANLTMLYTRPQVREPLTDEQIKELLTTPMSVNGVSAFAFARAIEAAHGIGEKK